jgi:hypothetical protein
MSFHGAGWAYTLLCTCFMIQIWRGFLTTGRLRSWPHGLGFCTGHFTIIYRCYSECSRCYVKRKMSRILGRCVCFLDKSLSRNRLKLKQSQWSTICTEQLAGPRIRVYELHVTSSQIRNPCFWPDSFAFIPSEYLTECIHLLDASL